MIKLSQSVQLFLCRGYLGQSQSKTELKFVREIENLPDYGFHLFEVSTEKAVSTAVPNHQLNRKSRLLLGVHIEGIFLFDPSSDISTSHRVTSSFYWHRIARIQYDKTRFQLLMDSSDKVKFYVSETKAKLMFDLSSAHHQHSNKTRRAEDGQPSTAEHREPQRALRSLKSRLLSRRRSESSGRKLYTGTPTSGTAVPAVAAGRTLLKGQMRRSLTTAAMASPGKSKTPSKDSNYLVKRLAHYTSMADALMHTKERPNNNSQKEDKLNLSDKENSTPVTSSAKNYR